MRGYIRNRGKDSWQVCINAGNDPVTGRRRQRFATVRGKRKDAEALRTKLLYELDRGLDLEPGRVTTGGLLSAGSTTTVRCVLPQKHQSDTVSFCDCTCCL
jgi:hypothetical protein